MKTEISVTGGSLVVPSGKSQQLPSPFSRAAASIDKIYLDTPLDLKGSFDPNCSDSFRGSLTLVDQKFDLEIDNFRPSFAEEQYVRDADGQGLPDRLPLYKHSEERPISLTLDGETCEIKTPQDPGATLLPIIGRLITRKATHTRT